MLYIKLRKMWSLILLSFAGMSMISGAEIRADMKIATVSREIEATSQLVTETQKLELDNTGPRTWKEYLICIPPELSNNVAYVEAKSADGKGELKVTKTTLPEWKDKTSFYAVDLGNELKGGGKLRIEVMLVYSHALRPYPAKITQAENQHVQLIMSATLYSAYPVATQKTSIKLASSTVHSYSKDSNVSPVSHDGAQVTYGPYVEQLAFSSKPAKVHFENNSPFLTVTRLHRLIEVSHWGNIAVEETIDIVHAGAALKGPFSRYDFQRDHRPSMPVVKSFRTLLPASASDIYYRDEIGNISTSHVREHDDSVEVDIRPRFPLFGGWKTHYIIGYNVPSYEYLFRSKNRFALQMRFMDFIFENMVVDEITTRIILPERAHNVKLNTPYDVTEGPRETHYTFLDYTGRPVVVAHKTNLVENHIQNFIVEYQFDSNTMLFEPLMVVGSLFLFFLLVIIYVRLDFTIAKDAASEARLKVAGILEQIRSVLDDRSGSYDAYADAIDQARQNKDLPSLQTAKKKMDADLKKQTQTLTEHVAQLKQDSPEMADRMQEVTRLDRQIRDQLNVWASAAERFLHGKLNKQQYNDTEKTSKVKVDEWKGKIDNIAYGF